MRRKDVVRFSVKKAVVVSGESIRMLDSSFPIDFTGTGIVRFGSSALKTWVVHSTLVSLKNGRTSQPASTSSSTMISLSH